MCDCKFFNGWGTKEHYEVNRSLVIVPDSVVLKYNTPERDIRHEVNLDTCLTKEVLSLWELGIVTNGCCCGHNQQMGYIGVDGEYIEKMKGLGYETYPHLDKDRHDTFIPKSVDRIDVLNKYPNGYNNNP